jgi:hypothetical protein
MPQQAMESQRRRAPNKVCLYQLGSSQVSIHSPHKDRQLFTFGSFGPTERSLDISFIPKCIQICEGLYCFFLQVAFARAEACTEL